MVKTLLGWRRGMKIKPMRVFGGYRAAVCLENTRPFTCSVAAQETNRYGVGIILVLGSIGIVERWSFLSQDNDDRDLVHAVLEMSRTDRGGKNDEAQDECKNAMRHGGQAIAVNGVMSMKKWLAKHEPASTIARGEPLRRFPLNAR